MPFASHLNRDFHAWRTGRGVCHTDVVQAPRAGAVGITAAATRWQAYAIADELASGTAQLLAVADASTTCVIAALTAAGATGRTALRSRRTDTGAAIPRL